MLQDQSIRLPDLLLELDMARTEGAYKRIQAKYAAPVLLIIDEWLLMRLTEAEQHDILELLYRRRKESSTISSALSMTPADGMASLVVMAALLPKIFLTVSSMMPTKSTPFLLTLPTTLHERGI